MHADEVFLASPPKDHSIYITGLFDLHGAEGCDRRVASENVDSISLPLAFVYAVSHFECECRRQRGQMLIKVPLTTTCLLLCQ